MARKYWRVKSQCLSLTHGYVTSITRKKIEMKMKMVWHQL